jgi:ferrous iron transport protein B
MLLKNKSIVFLVAGKIILAISIVLWFMASYGPGKNSITPNYTVFKKRKTGIPQEN